MRLSGLAAFALLARLPSNARLRATLFPPFAGNIVFVLCGLHASGNQQPKEAELKACQASWFGHGSTLLET